ETGKLLVEQRGDRTVSDVAPRNPGAAVGDDRLDAIVHDPFRQHVGDLLGVVLDDLVRGDGMVPVGEMLTDELAAAVVVLRARIADGQDGAGDLVLRGGAVFFGRGGGSERVE